MTHGAMSNDILRNKIFDNQVRIFSKRILEALNIRIKKAYNIFEIKNNLL